MQINSSDLGHLNVISTRQASSRRDSTTYIPHSNTTQKRNSNVNIDISNYGELISLRDSAKQHNAFKTAYSTTTTNALDQYFQLANLEKMEKANALLGFSEYA